MCLSKPVLHPVNYKANDNNNNNNNNNKQGIPIPTHVYTSVMTQTLWHKSDFISY